MGETGSASPPRVEPEIAPAKPLRPAFRNAAQAAAFGFLIVVPLALPVILAKFHPVSREYLYTAVREQDGAFSFVRHEIFDVKDDIDILFAGNSTAWAGFDSPLVESELSRKLGRKAHAVTFGTYWPGLDVPYMQIHDVLAHKRVGMVVMTVPRTEFNDGPSPVGFRFLSYSDPPDTTEGLSLDYRLELYGGYVLRSPRDLLNYLRPIRPIPSQYAPWNGSMHSEEGFRGKRFVPYAPPAPEVAAGDAIYSDRTRDRFQFTHTGPPPYHVFYLRKLTELLKAHHTKFLIVSLPVLDDRLAAASTDRQCWPELLGPSAMLAGIPPSVLFHGMSEEEVKRLYYDSVHLNANGARYVTSALLPALLSIYGGDAR